jgi:hypothetical protein
MRKKGGGKDDNDDGWYERGDEGHYGRQQQVPYHVDLERIQPVWEDIARMGNLLNNDTETARRFKFELSVGTGPHERTIEAAAKKVKQLRNKLNNPQDDGKQFSDNRCSLKKEESSKKQRTRLVSLSY